MYLLSLKRGAITVITRVAYTPQMIVTLTNHQVGTVDRALQIFMQLRLVEELTDGTLFMTNIQSLIGKSSTEAEQNRMNRAKLKENSLLPSAKGGQMSELCPKVSQIVHQSIEIKSIEIRDKSIERRVKRTHPPTFRQISKYFSIWNWTWTA